MTPQPTPEGLPENFLPPSEVTTATGAAPVGEDGRHTHWTASGPFARPGLRGEAGPGHIGDTYDTDLGEVDAEDRGRRTTRFASPDATGYVIPSRGEASADEDEVDNSFVEPDVDPRSITVDVDDEEVVVVRGDGAPDRGVVVGREGTRASSRVRFTDDAGAAPSRANHSNSQVFVNVEPGLDPNGEVARALDRLDRRPVARRRAGEAGATGNSSDASAEGEPAARGYAELNRRERLRVSLDPRFMDAYQDQVLANLRAAADRRPRGRLARTLTDNPVLEHGRLYPDDRQGNGLLPSRLAQQLVYASYPNDLDGRRQARQEWRRRTAQNRARAYQQYRARVADEPGVVERTAERLRGARAAVDRQVGRLAVRGRGQTADSGQDTETQREPLARRAGRRFSATRAGRAAAERGWADEGPNLYERIYEHDTWDDLNPAERLVIRRDGRFREQFDQEVYEGLLRLAAEETDGNGPYTEALARFQGRLQDGLLIPLGGDVRNGVRPSRVARGLFGRRAWRRDYAPTVTAATYERLRGLGPEPEAQPGDRRTPGEVGAAVLGRLQAAGAGAREHLGNAAHRMNVVRGWRDRRARRNAAGGQTNQGGRNLPRPDIRVAAGALAGVNAVGGVLDRVFRQDDPNNAGERRLAGRRAAVIGAGVVAVGYWVRTRGFDLPDIPIPFIHGEAGDAASSTTEAHSHVGDVAKAAGEYGRDVAVLAQAQQEQQAAHQQHLMELASQPGLWPWDVANQAGHGVNAESALNQAAEALQAAKGTDFEWVTNPSGTKSIWVGGTDETRAVIEQLRPYL